MQRIDSIITYNLEQLYVGEDNYQSKEIHWFDLIKRYGGKVGILNIENPHWIIGRRKNT